MSKPIDEVMQARISRRGFLTGAAAAAITAGTAASPAAAAIVPEEARGQSDDKQGGKGYRLTQHVADYYKSAAR